MLIRCLTSSRFPMTLLSYRKHLIFKLNTSNAADLVRIALEKQLV